VEVEEKEEEEEEGTFDFCCVFNFEAINLNL
jgi:hypothetical protein